MVGAKALAETDKEQSRLDIIDDQLDVMGRAMLGLTLGCARCHDHKFDPIPTVDYYSLAGIFRSTEVFRDEVRNASMWHEWPLESKGAPGIMVMAPKESAPVNLRVHLRGNRFSLGAIAPRRFLQVLAGENHAPLNTLGSGRLELARWIATPRNPLTARVMVNRIWQHHFGRGLVATPDNFGTRGELPTHPELLDWLASEFVNHGWSVKHMHRTMLLSSTFQQSAHVTGSSGIQAGFGTPSANMQDGVARDPENRLFGRMPARRLDAEACRDAILAVSGRLEYAPGGGESGELLYERGEVIDRNRDFFRPNRLSSDDKFYSEYRRRSIYLPVVRNAVPDVIALFDGSDPNGVTATRNDTTVPSQALFLLNHPFVRESARQFALRILSDTTEESDRIDRAYWLALGRPARESEVDQALRFLEAYQAQASSSEPRDQHQAAAWQSFCQTLLLRNEFLYID
jgi:hypothetical protein